MKSFGGDGIRAAKAGREGGGSGQSGSVTMYRDKMF